VLAAFYRYKKTATRHLPGGASGTLANKYFDLVKTAFSYLDLAS
jgi:hypothetical protein